LNECILNSRFIYGDEKSHHHLKAIVVVPALPPDCMHNSRGVKYRKALLYSYFFTPLLLGTPSGGGAGTIMLALNLNEDALNNVNS
jgi:hypothetical protein